MLSIQFLSVQILNSGSGFKSLHSYQSGFFGAAIKLQPGYTAGVITSFYVRIIDYQFITVFFFA